MRNVLIVLSSAVVLVVGCFNTDPCDHVECINASADQGGGGGSPSTSTSMTTTSSTSADGGGGGTGGNVPCDRACMEPTPLCDEDTNTCVACLEVDDCDSVGTSHCNDSGACVPCSDSTECAHLAGTTVCDMGTCVECALGEEAACGGGTTCDLLAKTCTGAAPTTVQNCNTCTNDLQCGAGHRCIPMEFDGSAHGYYCLKDSAGGCSRPFGVLINEPSLSGAAATNYCGVDQDVVSCEAVLALIDGWVCTGTDGMCSPDGIQPEVATPGALCRQVGAFPNQCTYECGIANHCPTSVACGGAPTPTWCGG